MTAALLLAATLTLGAASTPSDAAFRPVLEGLVARHAVHDDEATAARILERMLPLHPDRTETILAVAVASPRLFSYLHGTKPLEVIFDNGLPEAVEVRVDEDRRVRIPGGSHRSMHLEPGRHAVVVSDGSSFLSETGLIAISPPTPRDRLLVNVGRWNSYRLTGYDRPQALRRAGDPSRGWPVLLRRPRMVWLQVDEIFPPEPRPVWAPLPAAGPGPRTVRAVHRIRHGTPPDDGRGRRR